MTDQRLTDELEKALRDEAYDGGFGYMGAEQFTSYVRTLAVTAAKVVEEGHTPTDDEREALLTEADALVASWDQKGSWSSDSPVGMVMRLAAALRRTEVPEPSTAMPSERERRAMTDLFERPDLDGFNDEDFPETPQGEPSDAQPTTIMRGVVSDGRFEPTSDWERL